MTVPIRVVHIAGTAEWAGGERYLQLLAEHVDRSRFHLEVVSPSQGPLVDGVAALGVPVHVLPLPDLVDPRAVVPLAALLRRLRPDIVQSHGARPNFYTRLAGRLARVPAVVSTVHNALGDYPVTRGRRALYIALDRLTLPLATRVICVARALAGEYGRRAVVIHNGIDAKRFDPVAVTRGFARRVLELGPEPVVGFVGRLTPQKDPLAFLDTIAAVRADVPAIRALIVGDGPLRAEVEAASRRHGLESAVTFTGVRHDVPAVLAAMDLVLAPSRSEGFPFVVLEAMAMERAVVSTAVNGVPEVIEDGVSGIVLRRGDVRAMAGAVRRLLAAPMIARSLGRTARMRILGGFTVDHMVDRTQQLYQELA